MMSAKRARRRDRRDLARLCDRARNGPGEFLFAENGDDACQVAGCRGRDHIRRACAFASHPHVERTVEAEREAAFGLIELHRRDADIHHDTVDRVAPLRAADVREVGESIFHQDQPSVGAIDEVEARGDRRAVAVDANYLRTGHRENRAAVTAGAKRRVDIDAAAPGREQFDGFGQEDGNVPGRLARACGGSAARTHSPAPADA